MKDSNDLCVAMLFGFGLVLIVLKLAGVIACSWWIVTLPFWWPFALILLFAVIAALAIGIVCPCAIGCILAYYWMRDKLHRRYRNA